MPEIVFLKLAGNRDTVCGPHKTCVVMPDAVHEIVKQSADSLGLPVSEFLGSANRAVSHERDIAIRRIRSDIRVCGRTPSTTNIGAWVGRDHSSIVASLARTAGVAVVVLKPKPLRPSIIEITRAACKRTGLDDSELRSTDRPRRHIAHARQEIWAEACRTYGHRLADIARYFHCDKKTVWDGIKAYESRQYRLAYPA